MQNSYQSLIDSYIAISDFFKVEQAIDGRAINDRNISDRNLNDRNLNGQNINDQQCYLLRTLLIHEYRRVLLKDHELPEDMLPENWAGFCANRLVKEIYAKLARPSCRYITTQLQNSNGFLPKVQSSFRQRFK